MDFGQISPSTPLHNVINLKSHFDWLRRFPSMLVLDFALRSALYGPAAIRSLFQAVFTEFGKPGTTFSLQLRSVEGDYAYILWRAETADNLYEAVADTFVMRNGQIVLHSFGGKIQSKNASIQ